MQKSFKCHCGRQVHLDRSDYRCPCGQWYNAFGQRLAPPSQWGEETGERFDERGNYVIGSGDDDY